MSPDHSLDYLAYIRDESDRFVAVLRDTDPSARVPTCPEWNAADLLWHVAEVHWMWAEVIARGITDGDTVDAEVSTAKPARPASYGELFTLYDHTTGAMMEALAAAADDEPIWTWSADQSVGFVRRFQAHEAMIHRVDAELAAGLEAGSLPAELADDGIDVVLRFGKTWRPGWADWELSELVGRVHATDTGREWKVRIGQWSGRSPDSGTDYPSRDAIELVSGGTLGAGFTVEGSAAALDGWLWQRPGFGDVTVTGQGAERFTALVEEGMP